MTAVASSFWPAFLSAPTCWLRLVAAGLQLLGGGNGFAAGLIEDVEVAEKRGRVGPAGAQFFFH